MPEFTRKPNRLPSPFYLGLRCYLVTLCTRVREPLFTSSRIVELLVSSLNEQAGLHSFEVYAYCFMPDHCHLLLYGLTSSSNLSSMVRAYKARTVVQLRNYGLRNVWQRSFHDHIIRNERDFRAATAYVLENPVRAGLITDARQWPYSGP
jgi:putative transposase